MILPFVKSDIGKESIEQFGKNSMSKHIIREKRLNFDAQSAPHQGRYRLPGIIFVMIPSTAE